MCLLFASYSNSVKSNKTYCMEVNETMNYSTVGIRFRQYHNRPKCNQLHLGVRQDDQPDSFILILSQNVFELCNLYYTIQLCIRMLK